MRPKSLIEQLQRITLESQGLTKAHPFGKGKRAVAGALEHLGYIQIDTLSVVARAHHHTLWTRVPSYKNEYLNKLVEEREAFEYWFHAAAYLPMKDFRFAQPRMSYFQRGESSYFNKVDDKDIQFVLDRIRIDGPQKARDFKTAKTKAGSWWNWKPAKMALEKLFMQGDLMICRREGMEKIYDLPERVLPATVDTSAPSESEYAEYLVETHLRAYGFTTVKQSTHLRPGRGLRDKVKEILQSKLDDKSVHVVDLDGLPDYYVKSDLLDKPIRKPAPNIRLLSPFDNSIIHRDRIQQLFGFDYKIECYTPKEKRLFGYFCLPILFGEKLIGRVDCKAHRKTGEFEIIHLHIEDELIDLEEIVGPLVDSMRHFMAFNDCHTIRITRISPKQFTSLFQSALKNEGLMK